jgi:hypothetical protein
MVIGGIIALPPLLFWNIASQRWEATIRSQPAKIPKVAVTKPEYKIPTPDEAKGKEAVAVQSRGLVLLISIVWSLLVATAIQLTGTETFGETSLLWIAAFIIPLLVIGFLSWFHRIRILLYIVMLLWLIWLFTGEKAFIFIVPAGYPAALLYEYMTHKYGISVSKDDS